MTMLVSLTQAKARLNFDTNDKDADLTLAIEGASAAVLRYVRNGPDLFLDSSGDVIEDSNGDPIGIPADIQNATIYLAGWFIKNADSDAGKEFPDGYLPLPVKSLLLPYRDPSLA